MAPNLRSTLLVALLSVTSASCLKVPEEFSEEPNATKAAPSTVGEVLDRHVAALGGAEALKELQQRTIEARMVIYPESDCPEESKDCVWQEKTGSFLFQTTADGHMYRRNVLDGVIEERGFDGKLGWSMVGATGLHIDDPKQAELNREEALLHWYFGVAKRNVQTTLLSPRETDSDGVERTLDGVKWQVPGGPKDKQLWFDRATGLRHEEISIEKLGDEEQRQTVVYEDYRPVDGVLVPYAIKVTNTLGDRSQLIVFKVQLADHKPVDAKKFVTPQLPKADRVPDPVLTELAKTKQAAQEAPKDVLAQLAYARTAFIAGHFETSSVVLRTVLKLQPKEPEALVLQARIQVMQGDYKRALRTLAKAKRYKIREDIIAREHSWIYHRQRNFPKLANALQAAGNPTLAGRYRTFVGKPTVAKLASSDRCKTTVKMVTSTPLAIVELDIGGKKIGAIVDTGAGDLIFTQQLADELHIETKLRTQIAKGMPPVGHASVPKVTLGGLTLSNVPINIFDDASIADMAGPEAKRVQAVLGLSTLSQFVIGFDVPGGTIDIVSRSARCKAQRAQLQSGPSIPFWEHETHYLYVMAELNEAEGIYLVNTGMRGADLTSNETAYSHAGIGAPAVRGDAPAMVEVKRLELGDAYSASALRGAWGYFQQQQTADGFRLDGMLGLGALGHKKFVVDYEQHRIHFPSK